MKILIFGIFKSNNTTDDAVKDFDIDIPWLYSAGESRSLNADKKLYGWSDNIDRNEIWYNNLHKSSYIPE